MKINNNSAANPVSLDIEVVRSLSGLGPLAKKWDALAIRSVHPSIFLSFDYMITAWKDFHQQDSDPFVLLIKDKDGSLVGIAPFRIARSNYAHLPIRRIDYLVTWEIDKPYIIVEPGYERDCWRAIIDYLRNEFRNWDILAIKELSDHLEGSDFLATELDRVGLHFTKTKGPEGPVINLDQAWDDFRVKHRSIKKGLSRLRKLPEPFRIATYDRPENILDGLAKFVAIERMSWKAHKVGIAKDAVHLKFYRDVAVKLAAKGHMAIQVMSSGGNLLAGEVTYSFGPVVFFSHSAYNQEYARLSVGRVLSAFVIKDYFVRPESLGDFMCGYAGYCVPWSDGLRTTWDITVYNNHLSSRMALGMHKLAGPLKGLVGRLKEE